MPDKILYVKVYTMSNVNGGDVHIKAGDAGVHGSGGNIEINGGSAGVTIKGGDAISHPISSRQTKKQWFEKPLGRVFLGLVVAVLGGCIVYYLGWH